ncbi:Hypp4850 [Branchiostoma lanceolatum]|uniref:Hypp4850 protein n=1 Tax=Branchiostoma lanceolatum TaxID=7740 RepID=A0A8K0AEH5_BRALA|nr:Hypp4850 [Branchiostoma lanceolatum]
MAAYGLLVASLFTEASRVLADDLCEWDDNYKTCYGDFAYCCGLHEFECCDDGYYVYSAWWFWLIWVFLIIFIMACSYIVRRRCLATHTGTVIIQRTTAPPPTVYGATYGTQPHQYNATAPPLYQNQSDKQTLLH